MITIADIKGLYFKLNIDHEPDKSIYKFFEENKELGNNKIYVLSRLIEFYEENTKNE